MILQVSDVELATLIGGLRLYQTNILGVKLEDLTPWVLPIGQPGMVAVTHPELSADLNARLVAATQTKFTCGKYRLEIERSQYTLGLTAYTTDDQGRELRASVIQVSGILGEILTYDQAESQSSQYEENDLGFDTEEEADFAELNLRHMLEPQYSASIEKNLDDDRAAGEWSFPSDEDNEDKMVIHLDGNDRPEEGAE